MSFQQESEMAQPVRRWLRQGRFLVKEEFVLPWGICDFVAVSMNPVRVDRRIELGQRQPIGPLHRINMLNEIPDHESGQAISFRRLRRACGDGVSELFIRQQLEKLIAHRFVVQRGKDTFQRLNGWAPLHDRIIAVELKLNRISEALAQAYSNRAFATESYVGFPTEIAKRISETRRNAEFLDAGVGVIAVSKTKCKIVLRPADTGLQADAAIQMHCVERFWRTKDSSA